MVNLGLIFKAEEKLVNDIIKDIRENNFAWEVLQYINSNYAEVEIDHDCFSYWNKEKYEEFLHTDDKEAEIRINRGYVYRYVNIHGNTELDRDWDDTEEEWEEYRDFYEEFDGMESECVPKYVRYGNMEKEFLIDEHKEEILQLEKELIELITYDEWSAIEYGEEKVDYYWTAFNLLKAGYRKVT